MDGVDTTRSEPGSLVPPTSSLPPTSQPIAGISSEVLAAVTEPDATAVARLLGALFAERGSAPAFDPVAAMDLVDWSSILTIRDPSAAAAMAVAEVLRALAGGPPADVGAAFRTGSVLVGGHRAEPSTETTHTETKVTDGTVTVTKTVDKSATFDPESGRETTTVTVVVGETDSATGARSVVEMTYETAHDVCWGPGGDREGSYAVTARSTSQEGSSVRSNGASVTVAPDGSGSVTRSASVDGHTVTVASGSDEPPGNATVTETVSGDTATVTREYENGTRTVFEGPSSDPSESAVDEAAKQLTEEGSLDRDISLAGAGLARPRSGQGSDEFCLRMVVDPASTTLDTDGATVELAAAVEDWNERPVGGAAVTIAPPRLGSVSPAEGRTSDAGALSVAYTAQRRGRDLVEFRADHYGYSATAESAVTVGRGGAFSWSESKFGQTATVTARSCDGALWEGTLTFGGSPGGAELDMAASFSLTLPEGESVTIPVESKGTITAAGETLGIEFLYSLDFAVEASGSEVRATFTRQPGGGITVRGATVPFPAASFEEFQVTAPIEPAKGCP